MKPIVVVGSVNMDIVCRAERIPRPGETVLGHELQFHAGGKGANQAAAIARLGGNAIFLGKVGSDSFGRQLLEGLQNFGVDISEAEVTEGGSGTACITVDAGGENSIVVTPAANASVSAEYIDRKRSVLAKAGMVLAQLEIPIATIERLAELCEELHVPLVLDPAPAQPLSDAVLSRVSWFTPNESEARFYAKDAGSEEDFLASMFSRGVGNIILKKGADGAVFASADGSRRRVAAFAVPVEDTTAAGDVFNAAAAFAMMEGRDVVASLEFASAAAAISVSRRGAQSSLPSNEDVSRFMAERVGRI